VRLLRNSGRPLLSQPVLVGFDQRTMILPADAIVHRDVLEGVQGVWRDPEAGAESVRHLVRVAQPEDAELLISHDPVVRASWPHAPEAYA
jgi:glyoxylase-like metal-dependent hydrolase (beta-lactamase superfamily II)